MAMAAAATTIASARCMPLLRRARPHISVELIARGALLVHDALRLGRLQPIPAGELAELVAFACGRARRVGALALPVCCHVRLLDRTGPPPCMEDSGPGDRRRGSAAAR